MIFVKFFYVVGENMLILRYIYCLVYGISMVGYKSKAQIIGDMLTCANDGASVSDMIQKSSTSHSRVSSILGTLISRGLMEQCTSCDNRRYHTSNKGRNFLQEYKKFQRFSENFGMTI